MEEDKLKDIFSSYDPELSSSFVFMERLERNLNAVELIHQENEDVMKRNRIAVWIASCAGFITGIIFTLLFPYIYALVHSILSAIPAVSQLPEPSLGIHILSWLLIGGISVLVALNSYSISTTLLTRNQGVLGSNPSGTTT